MNRKEKFVDILKPRNTQFGIFKFMTKYWEPKKTMKLDKELSTQELKQIVANSIYIETFLEAESKRTETSKQQLKKEVLRYLDEIAMDKKLHIIRWMGIVFLKISFMMKIGMYVDEAAVLKLKSSLGNNPVLLLPTHRSYADFCLLTYLCYHYDIELPAVTAGMDFYTMAVVGQSMRETGAFYMRRTLVGAPLYAATLRHYVRTLMAKHNAPVEFFLEGTRSRSNKCLAPKFGIMSMSLMPYFAREVTNITIVPINISYDRLMEQSLFAYEHLGVPKPKETTGGLLKSLHKLNDNYGNIYIKFGDPISMKEYLGDEKISPQTILPVDLQQLDSDQVDKVQQLAEHVVTLQQENTVVTITNLLSIVLMDSLFKNKVLELEEAVIEVEWLISMLVKLGATVFENDVRNNINRILVVHKSMLRVEQNRLRLISSALMNVNPEIQKKMKGHILKAETMVNAIPIIQLQLYVNPVLHYMIPPAIVFLIVSSGVNCRDKLSYDYRHIRKLLRYEFYHVEDDEEANFKKAVEYCLESRVIKKGGDSLTVDSGGGRTGELLQWVALPALTLLCCAAELMAEKQKCEHKSVLKLIQERAEVNRLHPYCLSLEATANCLLGLVHAGALARHKTHEVTYEAVPEKLQDSISLVNSIIPKICLDYSNNSVILSQNVVSKL